MLLDIFIYSTHVKFKVLKYENKNKDYILIDDIFIPKSFNVIDRLKYIRNMIKTIIITNTITSGRIQVVNDKLDEQSIKLEGVIQELFSTCGVKMYGN